MHEEIRERRLAESDPILALEQAEVAEGAHAFVALEFQVVGQQRVGRKILFRGLAFDQVHEEVGAELESVAFASSDDCCGLFRKRDFGARFAWLACSDPDEYMLSGGPAQNRAGE